MAHASWVVWRQFNKGALYTGVGREVTRAMGISGTITIPSKSGGRQKLLQAKLYGEEGCLERS